MRGYYRVVWRIEKELILRAESEEDAREEVTNRDCEFDGVYVDNSFEIVKVEEVE